MAKNALVPHQAQPQPMAFQGQKVRHVLIADEPWFVAADVCRCLGLGLTKGTHQHLRNLEDDEHRRVTKGEGPVNLVGPLFSGMESLHTLISESGLYKIVLRAQRKNPVARTFQDWVTREVLPSIRKTGSYSLAPAPAAQDFKLPTTFAEAFRLAADESEKREEAESDLSVIVGRDEPGERPPDAFLIDRGRRCGLRARRARAAWRFGRMFTGGH